MKRRAAAVFFGVLVAGAAPAPAQAVQLKGGEVLVGKVEADEDGLTVRRLDNGGVLQLRWDQLSPESAGRIKTLFSLSVDEEGELMVTAEQVEYELSGGGREKVVGRVISQTDTTIVVRRQGMNYPVPRGQIKHRSAVEVPATDVYGRDEFYHEKLNEIAPGDDANKHVLLADVLTRVRDYDHAAAHLEQAKKLGGGLQPNLLDGKIKRLKLFKESADEREHLDRIRVALARREFQKGVALIEEYPRKFPDGKLQGEFARTKQRLEQARTRYLTAKVTELWYKTAYALARKKASEAGVTYDTAKDYAENGMGQDIRARIQKVLGIEPDEVEDVWSKRLEGRGGPRAQRYSYGVGSWTLGADAVIKGVTKIEESAEPKSERDQEMERMVERIRKARERARRALSQQQNAGANEATPEQWWESATPDERLVWLRAYYAEFGGDLVVEYQNVNACVTCGAEGRLTVFAQSGKPQKVECPTCHGTRYRRWVRAR